MAEYEDFTIDQGADVAIEIHCKETDGSNKDLTNHTATSKMKRNYNSTESVDFACTIPDPATSGTVVMALTNLQTDALNTSGRYVYDVELSFTDDDGNTIIERILEGKIKVNPSVTK